MRASSRSPGRRQLSLFVVMLLALAARTSSESRAVCPRDGGRHFCALGSTCCAEAVAATAREALSCCPSTPHAVCCAGMRHCCAAGRRCVAAALPGQPAHCAAADGSRTAPLSRIPAFAVGGLRGFQLASGAGGGGGGVGGGFNASLGNGTYNASAACGSDNATRCACPRAVKLFSASPVTCYGSWDVNEIKVLVRGADVAGGGEPTSKSQRRHSTRAHLAFDNDETTFWAGDVDNPTLGQEWLGVRFDGACVGPISEVLLLQRTPCQVHSLVIGVGYPAAVGGDGAAALDWRYGKVEVRGDRKWETIDLRRLLWTSSEPAAEPIGEVGAASGGDGLLEIVLLLALSAVCCTCLAVGERLRTFNTTQRQWP